MCAEEHLDILQLAKDVIAKAEKATQPHNDILQRLDAHVFAHNNVVALTTAARLREQADCIWDECEEEAKDE